MANSPEHHLRLLIGELAISVAKLTSENEQLREEVTILRAARGPIAPPAAPPGPATP